MKFPDNMLALIPFRGKTSEEKIPLKSREAATNGVDYPAPYTLLQEDGDECKKNGHQENENKRKDIENGGEIGKEEDEDKSDDKLKEEAEKGPMSPLRKFCFFLSINCWVLYIVAFAWLLPCKLFVQPTVDSLARAWRTTLPGEDISTNLEVFPLPGNLSPILIFGYTKQGAADGEIVALNGKDGRALWNLPLTAKPTRIHCEDIKVDGVFILECIITDVMGQLLAVNASGGNILWNRTVKSMGTFFKCEDKGVQQLAVVSFHDYNASLDVVSPVSGERLVSPVSLEGCTEMPFQMKTWKISPNNTELIILCSGQEDSSEVWSISVEDLCYRIEHASVDMDQSQLLKRLYRFDSDTETSSEPISYSNSERPVALLIVSDRQNLTVLIEGGSSEEWTKNMGIPGVIRAVGWGQFSNSSCMELVVVTDYNNSSKVLVFNLTNGEEVWSSTYPEGIIIDAVSLSRGEGRKNMMLLKTLHPDSSSPLSCQLQMEHSLRVSDIPYTQEMSDSYLSTCTEVYVLLDLLTDSPFREVFRQNLHPTESMAVCDLDRDGMSELVLAGTDISNANASDLRPRGIIVEMLRLNTTVDNSTCSSASSS